MLYNLTGDEGKESGSSEGSGAQGIKVSIGWSLASPTEFEAQGVMRPGNLRIRIPAAWHFADEQRAF